MTEPQSPFVIVPTYVLEEAPDAVAVYCAFRRYADFDTGVCWPSIDRVADDLGKSRRTVQRHLRSLVAIGAVAVDSGKDTGSSSRYQFPRQRFPTGGYDTSDLPGRTPVTHRVGHQCPTNKNQRTTSIEPSEARPRDLLWECFVEVHGEPASKQERGKYNAVVKQLREANVGPDEYPRLVQAFTAKHGGLQPAVATVAQRVGELRHFAAKGPIRTVDPVAESRWDALSRRYEQEALDAGQ